MIEIHTLREKTNRKEKNKAKNHRETIKKKSEKSQKITVPVIVLLFHAFVPLQRVKGAYASRQEGANGKWDKRKQCMKTDIKSQDS